MTDGPTDQTSTADEAPPSTVTEIDSAIDAKMRDGTFMRLLEKNHLDGHDAAIKEWQSLHEARTRAAHGDVVTADDEPAEPEAQATVDAAFAEVEASAANEFGPTWRGDLDLARTTLRRLGDEADNGDALVAGIVESGRGDDLALIRDLHDLGKQDAAGFPAIGLAKETLREYGTKDAARLRIARLEADGAFMDKWLAGDQESVLVMRTLQTVVAWDHREEIIRVVLEFDRVFGEGVPGSAHLVNRAITVRLSAEPYSAESLEGRAPNHLDLR